MASAVVGAFMVAGAFMAGAADTLASSIGPGKDPFLIQEFEQGAGDHDEMDGI